jgi:uncharacterized protein YndB with AHSA1/START domain
MTAKERSKRAEPLGIEKSAEINAPPQAVFDAVSTPEGIRGWWCKNVTGSGAKGGELVLKFPGGHVATVSLAKSAKPSKVEWAVKDHNAMKEWIGTKILFEIQSKGRDRSEVNFLHDGLTPNCECYGPCDGAWGYLMGSLKDFAEKGQGGPA